MTSPLTTPSSITTIPLLHVEEPPPERSSHRNKALSLTATSRLSSLATDQQASSTAHSRQEVEPQEIPSFLSTLSRLIRNEDQLSNTEFSHLKTVVEFNEYDFPRIKEICLKLSQIEARHTLKCDEKDLVITTEPELLDTSLQDTIHNINRIIHSVDETINKVIEALNAPTHSRTLETEKTQTLSRLKTLSTCLSQALNGPPDAPSTHEGYALTSINRKSADSQVNLVMLNSLILKIERFLHSQQSTGNNFQTRAALTDDSTPISQDSSLSGVFNHLTVLGQFVFARPITEAMQGLRQPETLTNGQTTFRRPIEGKALHLLQFDLPDYTKLRPGTRANFRNTGPTQGKLVETAHEVTGILAARVFQRFIQKSTALFKGHTVGTLAGEMKARFIPCEEEIHRLARSIDCVKSAYRANQPAVVLIYLTHERLKKLQGQIQKAFVGEVDNGGINGLLETYRPPQAKQHEELALAIMPLREVLKTIIELNRNNEIYFKEAVDQAAGAATNSS